VWVGLGVWDDALVIDLSLMRSTTVSPQDHTVRVDGGCTWADVDHATVAFGMATPSGVLSSTGVGGLTLGGGIGYLARRFGLPVDNLLAADVVLADGTRHRLSYSSWRRIQSWNPSPSSRPFGARSRIG
jgi:FAD/FMN-containing dehydrogenase